VENRKSLELSLLPGNFAAHEREGTMRDLDRRIRVAARALGRAGLVHAYGHCSARIDADSFIVCAARPMGLIAPGEAGSVVPVDGPLPDGVLGEVRIHQQIYRRRPDVQGVCRTMPPYAIILSTQLRSIRPRHGLGSYFTPPPPVWPDPRLLRSDAAAGRLADMMGDAPALLMRGNGVVTAAASLEEAVVLTWFLEDAARIEVAVAQMGGTEQGVLSDDEVRDRAVTSGRIFERMWEHLTAGDPESGAT
jgi:HCOMODA/2-hydroxy-3-carboxy-muconic semialdehyde decarboxylase